MSFVYAEFFDNSLFALPALNWTSCREQNNKDVIAHCSVLALYALNDNWIQLQLQELVDVRSQNQIFFDNFQLYSIVFINHTYVCNIYWMNDQMWCSLTIEGCRKVPFDNLKFSMSITVQKCIFICVGLGNINWYQPHTIIFRANLVRKCFV